MKYLTSFVGITVSLFFLFCIYDVYTNWHGLYTIDSGRYNFYAVVNIVSILYFILRNDTTKKKVVKASTEYVAEDNLYSEEHFQEVLTLISEDLKIAKLSAISVISATFDIVYVKNGYVFIRKNK